MWSIIRECAPMCPISLAGVVMLCFVVASCSDGNVSVRSATSTSIPEIMADRQSLAGEKIAVSGYLLLDGQAFSSLFLTKDYACVDGS
jgi:hypothetical protein